MMTSSESDLLGTENHPPRSSSVVDDHTTRDDKSKSSSMSHPQQPGRRVLLPALRASRDNTSTLCGETEDDTTNSIAATSSTGSVATLTSQQLHRQPPQRVLRYGETVHSLFCLPPDGGSDVGDSVVVDATRHKRLCQNICHGEFTNDVMAWVEALIMTLRVNCSATVAADSSCDKDDNNGVVVVVEPSSSLLLGKRLLQLLRRATSRFQLTRVTTTTTSTSSSLVGISTECEEDDYSTTTTSTANNNALTKQKKQQQEDGVLKLWLLYALVLVKYSSDDNGVGDGATTSRNDAGQTYKHIQRLRFSGGGDGGDAAASSSSLRDEFYAALLVVKNNNNNNGHSSSSSSSSSGSSNKNPTTVDEVVRSLKETMDNGTSLIDIFHTQMKQLEEQKCRHYRCYNDNDYDVAAAVVAATSSSSSSVPIISSAPRSTNNNTAVATTATSTTRTTSSSGRGRERVIALPTIKGVKRTNHHQNEQEKMSTLTDNTTNYDDDDNNNKMNEAVTSEDTFDLKLKNARLKLEEGLNNINSSNNNNNNNNKRSKLLAGVRKRPRVGGKLGAILSQTMKEDDDDDHDDDDDDDNNHKGSNNDENRAQGSISNISPKEHTDNNSLFLDNISPIEAEPSTSIKDMDLDYLLNWDPTKRGGSGFAAAEGSVVVSRNNKKKKVTILEEDDDGKGGEDDEDAMKRPVKKITRNDLGYMLNWEPFADRQKKEEESVGGSCSSSSGSKDVLRPKRIALASTTTRGMSTIDEGTEGSIEEDESPIIMAQTEANKKVESVGQELDNSRASGGGNDTSGRTDGQADKSEKMIPTSQLDCAFLPLIENKNIIRVDGEPYAKLGVIGKGGSCKVYRALSTECDVVALKKVKLDGLNKHVIDGYANEIALLKRLKGNPAIIQLYSAEVDYERKSILLVMELGEVDLNYVLRQQELLSSKQKGGPGRSSLNMNFIRLTWQQMLTAVHSIHEERIIHSDLKPANFLFVRGALKLIDFGIAKAIEREDTTNVYRETLSGTLSYMSPEAIMDTSTNAKGVRVNKCGRPSDIWSLGCILYQMVYGKTPFADCNGIPQKVLAITNVNHDIPYPGGVDESAIDAMKLCLQRNPKLRPPIVGKNGLLNDHYFLHGKTKSNQN